MVSTRPAIRLLRQPARSTRPTTITTITERLSVIGRPLLGRIHLPITPGALPTTRRRSTPRTRIRKLDQKHQQQLQDLRAQQDLERQKVEQQQQRTRLRWQRRLPTMRFQTAEAQSAASAAARGSREKTRRRGGETQATTTGGEKGSPETSCKTRKRRQASEERQAVVLLKSGFRVEGACQMISAPARSFSRGDLRCACQVRLRREIIGPSRVRFYFPSMASRPPRPSQRRRASSSFRSSVSLFVIPGLPEIRKGHNLAKRTALAARPCENRV